MNCPKCNAEIQDGAVVCSECGEHFAVELQRGKFLAARANTKTILENICRSRLFLVLSIFMSILCGASALCTLQAFAYDHTFNIRSIFIFVFSIIAIIAAWTLYSGKQKLDTTSIKSMKRLNTLLRVFANIIYIAMIVAFVLLLICLPVINAATEAIRDNDIVAEAYEIYEDTLEELVDQGVISTDLYYRILEVEFTKVLQVATIALLVICAVVAVFYAFMANAYKKADKYIAEIDYSVQNSEYRATKTPSTFLFVMGIIHAVFALNSVSNGIWALLETGCISACMIVLALVFKKVHEEQIKNNATIAAEEAELIRISTLTNEYVKREAEAQKAANVESQSSVDTQSTENTAAND